MADAAPITERDRQIMAALADPKGGAAGGVDPFEYAEWVQRPEIQRALDAHDEIKSRNDQAIARAFRDEMLAEARAAVATLKANARAADALKPPEGAKESTREQFRALAESTRASAHIIRLATRYLNPPGQSPRHHAAHTEPRIPRHRNSVLSPQSSVLSARPDSPSQPASPPAPPAPSPLAHPDPDATAEQAAHVLLQALRDNDNPHPDAGIATAYAFNHDPRQKPRDWTNYRTWFMRTQAPVLLGHRAAVIYRALVTESGGRHHAPVPVEINTPDGARRGVRLKFERSADRKDGPCWRYVGLDDSS